jgi:hypothetical protein
MNYVGRIFCRVHPRTRPIIVPREGQNSYKCCPDCRTGGVYVHHRDAHGFVKRQSPNRMEHRRKRIRLNHETWEQFAQRKGFEADERVPGDVDIAITYKAEIMPRGMYSVRR